MFLKAIFIYICMFPDDWIYLVKEAIKNFKELEISVGGFSISELMQNHYNVLCSITINLLHYMNDPISVFIYPAYIILCWVGFFIGMFPLFFALVINTISFYILLFITPIAFYFLIFGRFLKQAFTQWLQMILSNILTLIFLKIFIVYALITINSYLTTGLNQIGKDDFGDYKIALVCVFCGICLKVFTSIITSLAEKLTQVSIDNAVGNSMIGGLQTAGIVAGATAFSAKKATKMIAGNREFGAKKAGKMISSGMKQTGKNIKAMYNKFKNRGGKE